LKETTSKQPKQFSESVKKDQIMDQKYQKSNLKSQIPNSKRRCNQQLSEICPRGNYYPHFRFEMRRSQTRHFEKPRFPDFEDMGNEAF